MKKQYVFLTLGILVCVAFYVYQSQTTVKSWPTKPLNVFVGWSSGGSSDVVTRAVCMGMEKALGQKMLVTNVTGAQGSIAAAQVVKTKADGYHLFGGAAVHGTWPVMGQSDVSWTDFYAFLSVVFPTTIYVQQDAPWQTLEEFLTDIRNHPEGHFKVGHPGAGSNGSIFAHLVFRAAGLSGKVLPIPYKGGREAGRYLLSGEVQCACVTIGDLIDWAEAGRVRPLANLFNQDIVIHDITFPAITHIYPELEPFQAINPHMGVYVRRDTAPEIVTRIAEAFMYAIQQQTFQRLALQERAGRLSCMVGRAADEKMSKIESARGWALFELGVAPRNPADFGIPEISRWHWPPYERAAGLKLWPDEVEKLYEEYTQTKNDVTE